MKKRNIFGSKSRAAAVPGRTRLHWLGMLASVCFIATLVLNFAPDRVAQAVSFSSPAQVGSNIAIYDLNVQTRPTDNQAFIAGARGNVWVASANNPSAIYDINDSGALNAGQWPSLAFGTDGTGYVAWRSTATDKFRAYMRILPSGWNGGGDLPGGFDLSARVSQAAGVPLDQPALAYSTKANKLYVVGYFVTAGDATLGIVESSNGGSVFSNYRALVNDPTHSNMSPQICVDANDNIHVLSRIGSQLVSISRINGTWDSNPSVLNAPNWDARAGDGRNIKQISCAPDGTVYAVWKGPSGTTNLARRLPGQGWQTISNNLTPGGIMSTVISGVSPDGMLWIALGNDDGTNGGITGASVITSTNKGSSFSVPIPVYQRNSYGTTSLAIDASGLGGKIKVVAAFKGNLPEQTFLGTTDYTGPITPPTVKASAARFEVQPGKAEPGKVFGAQPVVTALDQNGNALSSFSGTIAVALSANPVGGTLAGTSSVTAVNGSASFDNLSIDKVGWGYQLTATVTNSDGTSVTVTSAPFMVSDVPSADQRNVPIGLKQFQDLWNRSDKAVADGQTSRSYTWGPSITGVITEPYTQGGSRQVQYFDKTRMEQTEGRGVTNGLLAKELITGLIQLGDADFRRYTPNNTINIAGDQGTTLPNPTYASFLKVATIDHENQQPDKGGQVVTATINRSGATGTNDELGTKYNVKNVYYDKTLQHNIPDVFWTFMNQSGPVYVNGGYTEDKVFDWLSTMGLPLSEAYWSRAVVAGVEQDVLVQVFERRVLTYTPSNPEAFRVEMGNVGQHYRDWRRSILLNSPSLPS